MDMRSYMEALEEERRKIQVFQRELPLCIQLVTQAIDACKNQFRVESVTTEESNRELEIVREFIPIRSVSTSDMEEEAVDVEDDKEKSDWLRSVSLWNHKSDNHINLLQEERESGAKSDPSSSGRVLSPPGSATTSSTANASPAVGSNRRSEEGPATRKQRRCWSAELHRRFVHALQQLGGSQVATPKQIKDRMKVDGLTNDEVKSHLQKYRLHTSPAARSGGDAPLQSQFVGVAVGGPHPPPPPPRSTTCIAVNRIYAPVSAAPQHKRVDHESALRKTETSQGTTTNKKGGATESSSRIHTIRVC